MFPKLLTLLFSAKLSWTRQLQTWRSPTSWPSKTLCFRLQTSLTVFWLRSTIIADFPAAQTTEIWNCGLASGNPSQVLSLGTTSFASVAVVNVWEQEMVQMAVPTSFPVAAGRTSVLTGAGIVAIESGKTMAIKPATMLQLNTCAMGIPGRHGLITRFRAIGKCDQEQ